MSNQEDQVREVFLEVVALPGEAREAALQRVSDPEIRARVRDLLGVRGDEGEFLNAPASQSFAELAGTLIGAGRHVAEFKLVREVGRGSMGVVYLAEDTKLGRTVAIKMLSPAAQLDAEAIQRFQREAQATARAIHPNIVQIFRSGQEHGRSFLVMEFVEGETLRSKLDAHLRDARRQDLPLSGGPRQVSFAELQDSVRWAANIADALEHTHFTGIIHRDVKPSNILIDHHGNAKLTDFGIARVLNEKTLTEPGTIAGSLPYMSPEQARVLSSAIDHRTDIFSLGVVLYECLTMQRPFRGETPQQLLRALQEHTPEDVRRLNRSIPRDLAIVCHKAIERRPEHRYQRAGHLAADLRSVLSGQPILAAAPSLLQRAWRWSRGHRPVVAVAAIIFLAVATAATSVLYVHARRATLAELEVPESMRGAQVSLLQPWNALQDASSPRVLGTAPLVAYLPPGMYRVRFVRPNGAITETSERLELGGRQVIEVRAASSSTLTALRKIPAGIYTLGEVRPPADDRRPEPAQHSRSRQVQVSAFRISPTEVSNREYREYVQATGAPEPLSWALPYNPSEDDLPVCYVSWDEANAYCRWRGVRLPTPDEWEIAARGPDGRVFPWGDAPRPEVRRVEPLDSRLGFLSVAVRVDIDPSPASYFELLHTCSNVQEYTEGCSEGASTGFVVKGRSWRQDDRCPPSWYGTLPSRRARSFDRGFRVAVSEPAQENANADKR